MNKLTLNEPAITYSENQNKQTMDEGTGLPKGACPSAWILLCVERVSVKTKDKQFKSLRLSNKLEKDSLLIE